MKHKYYVSFFSDTDCRLMPLNATQITAARAAMQAISQVINVEFVEGHYHQQSDGSALYFSQVYSLTGSATYSSTNTAGCAPKGTPDVIIDADITPTLYQTIFSHELGHKLGLYDLPPAYENRGAMVLDSEGHVASVDPRLFNSVRSVMHSPVGLVDYYRVVRNWMFKRYVLFPGATLLSDDIKILQAKYGPNLDANPGDDVHRYDGKSSKLIKAYAEEMNDKSVDAALHLALQPSVLYDPNGSNTIDLQRVTKSVILQISCNEEDCLIVADQQMVQVIPGTQISKIKLPGKPSRSEIDIQNGKPFERCEIISASGSDQFTLSAGEFDLTLRQDSEKSDNIRFYPHESRSSILRIKNFNRRGDRLTLRGFDEKTLVCPESLTTPDTCDFSRTSREGRLIISNGRDVVYISGLLPKDLRDGHNFVGGMPQSIFPSWLSNWIADQVTPISVLFYLSGTLTALTEAYFKQRIKVSIPVRIPTPLSYIGYSIIPTKAYVGYVATLTSVSIVREVAGAPEKANEESRAQKVVRHIFTFASTLNPYANYLKLWEGVQYESGRYQEKSQEKSNATGFTARLKGAGWRVLGWVDSAATIIARTAPGAGDLMRLYDQEDRDFYSVDSLTLRHLACYFFHALQLSDQGITYFFDKVLSELNDSYKKASGDSKAIKFSNFLKSSVPAEHFILLLQAYTVVNGINIVLYKIAATGEKIKVIDANPEMKTRPIEIYYDEKSGSTYAQKRDHDALKIPNALSQEKLAIFKPVAENLVAEDLKAFEVPASAAHEVASTADDEIQVVDKPTALKIDVNSLASSMQRLLQGVNVKSQDFTSAPVPALRAMR